jgi:hypothetical protein
MYRDSFMHASGMYAKPRETLISDLGFQPILLVSQSMTLTLKELTVAIRIKKNLIALQSPTSPNMALQSRHYDPQLITSSEVKSLLSRLFQFECSISGMNAKRGSTGNKNDNAAASSGFLSFLAFHRPAVDETNSVLPWVASRGHSYTFI